MNRFIIIILVILILLMTSSCSSNTSVILDDTSCQPPCWRSISMGLSKDEAEKKLTTMGDISKQSIRVTTNNRRFTNESIYWTFENRQEYDGDLFFHDSELVMIYFSMKNTIPLSTLIKKYGDPDGVFVRKEILDGIMVTVSLVYQKQGICLQYNPSPIIQEPQTYQINSSMPIKKISYIDSDTSESQTKFGCLEGLDEGQIKQYLQDWKGYGDYVVQQVK